jgi:hypothetical protein
MWFLLYYKLKTKRVREHFFYEGRGESSLLVGCLHSRLLVTTALCTGFLLYFPLLTLIYTGSIYGVGFCNFLEGSYLRGGSFWHVTYKAVFYDGLAGTSLCS